MTLDQFISTKGMTDAEFGDLIGRSQSAISRLRRGVTKPDWITVERIANATHGAVTPNDFLPAQSGATQQSQETAAC